MTGAPLWPEEGLSRFRDAQLRKRGLLPPKPPRPVIETPRREVRFKDKPCAARKGAFACGKMFTPTHGRSLYCPECK